MPDALTDILQSVRMRGSVFSRAALTAPWGVESGPLETGMFHAVVRGHAWVQLADGGDPVELERGDIALVPSGSNHFVMDAPGRPSQLIGDVTSVDERGMGHLVVEGGGSSTSLICGTVSFDAAEAHPVFSLLPPLVVARDPAGRMAQVVESIVRLIADEVDEPVPGSETVVARLTDVLLVYVLRQHIADLAEESGWLAALRDPAIGEALGLIHRYPARPWTVDQVATSVGMSRSAFFARFRDTVGETPAEYLTKWRIHLATRLLREEQCSVASAARRVGYGTEAAFSNAFTRIMGIRPGAYKRAA